MENSNSRFYVRLRGLPWSATKSDIQEFLKDVNICEGDTSILFTISEQGKRSGDAIVVMPTQEDYDKALSYNNKFIGKRYVEVTPCDAVEFEESLSRTAPKENEYVVRMRGLPYATTETDIRNFFSGMEIPSKNIIIIMDDQNRCSGEAYVEFLKSSDTQEAINKHRERMGSRFIEIFQSSRSEMAYVSCNRPTPLMSINTRTKRRISENERRPRQPYAENDFSGDYYYPSASSTSNLEKYIQVRGLPFECTANEILQFFHPLSVVAISMLYGDSGRFNGDADVYFSSDYDAIRALDFDKKRIGKRYVELFLKTRKVHTVESEPNYGGYKEAPPKRYPNDHPYPSHPSMYPPRSHGYEYSARNSSSLLRSSDYVENTPAAISYSKADKHDSSDYHFSDTKPSNLSQSSHYLNHKTLKDSGMRGSRSVRPSGSKMKRSSSISSNIEDNFFSYY